MPLIFRDFQLSTWLKPLPVGISVNLCFQIFPHRPPLLNPRKWQNWLNFLHHGYLYSAYRHMLTFLGETLVKIRSRKVYIISFDFMRTVWWHLSVSISYVWIFCNCNCLYYPHSRPTNNTPANYETIKLYKLFSPVKLPTTMRTGKGFFLWYW